MPMTTGTHKEGEMHNKKEFLRYYGEAEGENKWKEAENLEERRYDTGRRKMYTIAEWEKPSVVWTPAGNGSGKKQRSLRL